MLGLAMGILGLVSFLGGNIFGFSLGEFGGTVALFFGGFFMIGVRT